MGKVDFVGKYKMANDGQAFLPKSDSKDVKKCIFLSKNQNKSFQVLFSAPTCAKLS